MIKNLFNKIKSFISANPQRARFIGIILIIAIVPLTIAAALTVQNLTQEAGGGSTIRIADSNGATITTETFTPNVYIALSLPAGWKLPQKISANNNFIKNAYAAGRSCTNTRWSESGCTGEIVFSTNSDPGSNEIDKCIDLANGQSYKLYDCDATVPTFTPTPKPTATPTPTLTPTPSPTSTPLDTCQDRCDNAFKKGTSQAEVCYQACAEGGASIPSSDTSTTSIAKPSSCKTDKDCVKFDASSGTYVVDEDKICIVGPESSQASTICSSKFSGQNNLLNCAGPDKTIPRNEACYSRYCDPKTLKCADQPFPASAAPVLRLITIENSAEGLGGSGSTPRKIEINDQADFKPLVEWELRGLLSNEMEKGGNRSVLVTFATKDNGFVATHITSVTLRPPPQPTPTPTPTPTPNPFDVNKKDGVNNDDLIFVQSQYCGWGKYPACAQGIQEADTNKDNVVNEVDYFAVKNEITKLGLTPTPPIPTLTPTPTPLVYDPSLDLNKDGVVGRVDYDIASAKIRESGIITLDDMVLLNSILKGYTR